MDSPDSKKKKPKKKAPSPRRDGREAAVQYLYGNDIQGEIDFSDETLEAFWLLRFAKPAAQDFATLIIGGVRDHLSEIDDAIRGTLENFAFQRITPVDRNILRVGAYEVIFANDIPWQVAINEAVEIAKRFGSEESPGFINGILDNLRKTQETD
ncbi:transcription antitermination factor NusB [bacterium]|nr:transcription antitermination factor NusB [bacterium]